MDKQTEIGAHTLSWDTDLRNLEIKARTAKELGCGALEIFFNAERFSASRIRKVVEEFGLTPVGCAIFSQENIGACGDPLSTNENTRKKAERTMTEWLNCCEETGISLLVGPIASILGVENPIRPTFKELKAGVKTFRQIALVAAEKKIRIAIEPLQWSEAIWPNTINETLTFIAAVEETGCPKNVLGVLFDIYHALRMEESWFRAMNTALTQGKLFHIHAAGPNRTPPDINQHIGWQLMANMLSEANWKGIVTIESFGKECDLPRSVTGPGNRPSAKTVIETGVKTLASVGF